MLLKKLKKVKMWKYGVIIMLLLLKELLNIWMERIQSMFNMIQHKVMIVKDVLPNLLSIIHQQVNLKEVPLVSSVVLLLEDL